MKNLLTVLLVITICGSAMAQEKVDVKKTTKHTMHKTTKKSMHTMKDCVMMKVGKMTTMMGGKTSLMTKDMTMKNGTMVKTNGTVQMKNGKSMMLKDGDCVYMNGRVDKMKMDMSMPMHDKTKEKSKM